DGKADLALTAGGNAVSVLLNNGNGTFGPAIVSATNYAVSSVAVADFNRDGKADLALGSANSYYLYTVNDEYYDPLTGWWYSYSYDVYATDVGVSALEGNGDGTFASETDVFTNSSESADSPPADRVDALAVGDFDRDGYADVVGLESFGSAHVVIN